MTAPVRPEIAVVEDRDRLVARLGVPMSAITEFCERWNVQELALFGSVLRDDFGPDSDVDLLIRFGTENSSEALGVIEMERELNAMLARRVDLVSRTAVEASRNYIRRRSILESARIVYAT